jgi:hypothetical protein
MEKFGIDLAFFYLFGTLITIITITGRILRPAAASGPRGLWKLKTSSGSPAINRQQRLSKKESKMTESDVIRQLAQQSFNVSGGSGKRDHWLWDRTVRIVHNVGQLCRLPELAGQAISIERSCLIAAAYFSISGLAHSAGARNAGGPLNRVDGSDTDLCELSAKIATETLSGVLSEARLHTVSRIITESCNRFTDMTEAMVLSDARNLEDMGAVGLLHELRQHIINGKSISEILESWKCKAQYGYWQARLKESFRYDAVRQMAEQRYFAMEHFMDQLAAENKPCHLRERLPETALNK